MENISKNNLSLDQQVKLEQLRLHLANMHALLMQRSSVLPVVASLCIALLVVFSFRENLLSITGGELRILITVLLLLIPSSLFFHLAENYSATQNTYKAVKKILNDQDLLEQPKNFVGKVGRIILAYYAWILTSIFSLVVIYIIFLLWA